MNEQKLNLIANPRNFSNIEYGNVLDFFLELKHTIKHILNAHSPESTVEAADGFTVEEMQTLEYLDEIEAINWSQYDRIARQIALEIYFPSTGVTSLFMETLERIKFTISQMQIQINCMRPLNFDKTYKAELDTCYTNLNYCIMCSYNMYSVYNGSILVALNEYCASHNIKPLDFVKEFFDYYQTHRPTLVLFDKYPELAVALQEKIDTDYFETIVQFSSLISKKELEEIVEGELIVDDMFISNLEERLDSLRQEGMNE